MVGHRRADAGTRTHPNREDIGGGEATFLGALYVSAGYVSGGPTVAQQEELVSPTSPNNPVDLARNRCGPSCLYNQAET